MEMSKSEFAAHINVVPSRVTAMIASGMIGPEALVGEGRKARIRVDIATEHIRTRRNPSQAFGNGIATRIANSTPAPGAAPDVATQIQLQRLEYETRRNRQASIEEQQKVGRLVLAEDMQRAVAQTASSIISIYDSLATDLANELAAQFHVPSRDVLFAARRIIEAKRRKAAERHRTEAEQLPTTVEVML